MGLSACAPTRPLMAVVEFIDGKTLALACNPIRRAAPTSKTTVRDGGRHDPRRREVGTAPGPRQTDKAAARSFADGYKHKHQVTEWKGSPRL